MNNYAAIGLMSGTSLDGLDIAYCHFTENVGTWTFKIDKAVTIPYNKGWKTKLAHAHTGTAAEISQLHVDYGCYLGQLTKDFIAEHRLNAQLVASHGHTIFHTPRTGLTLQVGSGAHIAAACRLPVVCDFRTLDVALGGQGAPLVPMGDRLLFGGYDYCLNLGGIANISFERENQRIAFDVCPANMALNYLAGQVGLEYDEDGKLAGKGMVDEALLKELNALDFYKKPYPKSLGREWFEQNLKPLLERSSAGIEDKLATMSRHIGMVIANVLYFANNSRNNNGKMIVTGGGAHNRHLLNEIVKQTRVKIEETIDDIINYKEAAVFALLGVLKLLNRTNTLASVTGAKADSSGGTIYCI